MLNSCSNLTLTGNPPCRYPYALRMTPRGPYSRRNLESALSEKGNKFIEARGIDVIVTITSAADEAGLPHLGIPTDCNVVSAPALALVGQYHTILCTENYRWGKASVTLGCPDLEKGTLGIFCESGSYPGVTIKILNRFSNELEKPTAKIVTLNLMDWVYVISHRQFYQLLLTE